MSETLHLASEHAVGTHRMHLAKSATVGQAIDAATSDPQTRVVLMRRKPLGKSRYTHLHGLFSTGQTLTVFWTVLPLHPTSFGVDVRTYRLNPADVEACLNADVWGHEIIGYAPALADVAVLPSRHRFTVEHLTRPEGIHALLTDLCAPGSGILELETTVRAPAVPSGRVLLTRWNAFPELGKMVKWAPVLRVHDSEWVIYSTPAAHLQEMILEGVPLGTHASSLAEDLGDSDDVLMAAGHLYDPTSDSPYRWFQVAMNDARRLGAKPRPPLDPRRE